MKLVITIDTEEDNWDNYSPSGSTLRNIEKIPILQDLFDRFSVRPTYLITYPVATDAGAASIFRDILRSGRCEIGSHCHPWNTPPFEEVTSKKNSMMCNLDSDLQYKKLCSLHNTIKKNFDIEPVSFRSGRWGYNNDLAKNLCRLGYKIDTSITAYTDWSIYQGPDYSDVSPKPFRFSAEDIFQESSSGHMVEVPATVGFLQQNFSFCNRAIKFLSHRPVRYLRLTGVLYRLNMLNKTWLSPEVSDAGEMILLSKRMRDNKYDIINLFFHSSALMHGLTPFVKTKDDEEGFLKRIREFLTYAGHEGIESITLSETLSLY